MDGHNRQAAASYINNLLLSRGLLRNGQPIDFAPTATSTTPIKETMSQVMNLVHDLILRRDRENENMSEICQNLQAANSLTAQQRQNISRLEARSVDAERQVAQLKAQDRSAQGAVKAAEIKNRVLREEMARLKAAVAQIRTQCATDLRRRDLELHRLKKHLEARRGRDGGYGQVGVVVITPNPVTGKQVPRTTKRVPETNANGSQDAADSLSVETNEFLTGLSRTLEEENARLAQLASDTIKSLRSLQGLSLHEPVDSKSTSQSMGVDTVPGLARTQSPSSWPTNHQKLKLDMENVLDHLRGILTNPSFVPLEEVEIREEEIHRLREGWELMATRWREAVTLMAGWKTRMVTEGDTINLEDLKLGLQLGDGLPGRSASIHRQSANSDDDEASSINVQDPEQDLGSDESTISDERTLQQNHEAHASGHRPPLKEKSLNLLAERSPTKRHPQLSRVPPQPSACQSPQKSEWLDLKGDIFLEELSQSSRADEGSKYSSKSEFPSSSSTLTIAERLERAKLEAEEFEEAQRREIDRPSEEGSGQKAVAKKLKGARRRSTLSPEELENLMGR